MQYFDPIEPIVGKEAKIRLGLERMQKMMELLGHPEKKFKAVHIAGTNGKGSTATFIARILRHNRFKVGLYTSPHLMKVNERIKIDGEEISDQDLEEEVKGLKKLIKENNIDATYYEFLTALAFKYFAEQEVDFVVAEVGLGGRLDATNVLPAPLVCVITNIGLEHQEFLGETLEEIAREKIGIIKKDSFVVTAVKQAGIMELIVEKCAEQNAGLLDVNEYGPKVLERSFHLQRVEIEGKRLNLNMKGDFQVVNAALAFGCAEGLRRQGIHVSPAAVLLGLRDAFHSGRFEVVKKDPLLIFDSAHNPPGVETLVASLQNYFPEKKMQLVFGASKGRDLKAMMKSLKKVSDKVIVTTSKHPKAVDTAEIASAALKAGFKEVEIKESVEQAMAKAMKQDLPVCVCGSVYLVGEAKQEITYT